MLISNCCGYEVKYHDICSSCLEHTDPYEEEDVQELEEQEGSTKIEQGMEEIRDLIANKGIVNIDHADIWEIFGIAVVCLEGEPTTADEFNKEEE
jgi:hypothetical protein